MKRADKLLRRGSIAPALLRQWGRSEEARAHTVAIVASPKPSVRRRLRLCVWHRLIGFVRPLHEPAPGFRPFQNLDLDVNGPAKRGRAGVNHITIHAPAAGVESFADPCDFVMREDGQRRQEQQHGECASEHAEKNIRKWEESKGCIVYYMKFEMARGCDVRALKRKSRATLPSHARVR
jgi:hypothetical protein